MRILLAAIALVAMGQGKPPPGYAPSGYTYVTQDSEATQADTTLYVSATGNDGNACTASGTSACLTIQAAINKVPKRIRHLVTVNVGVGSFTGALWQGFTIEAAASTPAGIFISGTRQNFTPATGTATGTATAAANGASTSVVTWATLTDSGQTWTVNDLAGKFLEITAGTGIGQIFPIISNTATAVTVSTTTWTVPTGATYAIVDQGTVINAYAATALGIPATGLAAANDSVFYANQNVGLGFVNITGPTRTASIRVEFLKFSIGSAVAQVSLQSVTARTVLQRLTFASTTSTSACVQIAGASRVSVLGSYLTLAASGVGIDSGSSMQPALSALTFGSSAVVGASGSTVADVGGQMASLFFNSLYFKNGGFGFAFDGPIQAQFTEGIQIDGTTSQCLRCRPSNSSPGNCIIYQKSGVLDFKNSLSSGIEFDGPHYANILGVAIGSSNAIGWKLANGSRIKISSGSTLTGTTEISLDGVTKLLTDVRGASNKVLVGVVGSYIHEP